MQGTSGGYLQWARQNSWAFTPSGIGSGTRSDSAVPNSPTFASGSFSNSGSPQNVHSPGSPQNLHPPQRIPNPQAIPKSRNIGRQGQNRQVHVRRVAVPKENLASELPLRSWPRLAEEKKKRQVLTSECVYQVNNMLEIGSIRSRISQPHDDSKEIRNIVLR